MCVLTLRKKNGDVFFYMWLDISCNNSLLRWLFWVVGCLSCVFMRYMELRLFVNIYVGLVSLCVIFSVSCIAVSSTLSMFYNPSSL
jgi:hypothetical protein